MIANPSFIFDAFLLVFIMEMPLWLPSNLSVCVLVYVCSYNTSTLLCTCPSLRYLYFVKVISLQPDLLPNTIFPLEGDQQKVVGIRCEFKLDLFYTKNIYFIKALYYIFIT